MENINKDEKLFYFNPTKVIKHSCGKANGHDYQAGDLGMLEVNSKGIASININK
jgi:Cu/Zn superoxide dismutase